jgi:hypothetical protein
MVAEVPQEDSKPRVASYELRITNYELKFNSKDLTTLLMLYEFLSAKLLNPHQVSHVL